MVLKLTRRQLLAGASAVALTTSVPSVSWPKLDQYTNAMKTTVEEKPTHWKPDKWHPMDHPDRPDKPSDRQTQTAKDRATGTKGGANFAESFYRDKPVAVSMSDRLRALGEKGSSFVDALGYVTKGVTIVDGGSLASTPFIRETSRALGALGGWLEALKIGYMYSGNYQALSQEAFKQLPASGVERDIAQLWFGLMTPIAAASLTLDQVLDDKLSVAVGAKDIVVAEVLRMQAEELDLVRARRREALPQMSAAPPGPIKPWNGNQLQEWRRSER
ncbi:hypothetical protein AMC81_PA00015 (plasmid) [Rhizobium phaseoli]|uniref:Secreted protein n=2 Tax=Rhizobium phaseoli TaxID=396 RepID=A0ABM6CFH6_9HYPH|nr:hypothetical protein AMC81_PA00015 [Rhizobium phaseoli]ANL93548.1 hypothetical protein AMC80_PA00015 [Rhizobium phaseoli]